MVAALISFYLKQPKDSIILLAIVSVNAVIGFYQEWKSEHILTSIKQLVVDKCLVIRENRKREIFSKDLVPGDIVLLSEGEGVPADIQLIETTELSANEFILTGESLPSPKDHTSISTLDSSLTEIKNCVFMGTTIAGGTAKGIVYATGSLTEIGKISLTSEKIKNDDAPIQTEIKDIAKKLTYATIIIGLCLFGTKLLLKEPISDALIFAISVAAAMVPEGLPAQISVALALAVGRLAKRNAIVKQMPAAQTLGSATVIASDKTGTITKNEMTITNCYLNEDNFSVSGLGYTPEGQIINKNGIIIHKENLGDFTIPFLCGFLSSTGKINPPDAYHRTWYSIGDPTESAFATLAMKTGFTLEEIEKKYPIVKSFPFDSFRKRTSIIRTQDGNPISFVKGSLESVLEVSSKIISNGKIHDFPDFKKHEILSVAAAMAENALRIIALAHKPLEKSDTYTLEDAESNLIFGGFVSMYDPPHDEVKEAISSVFNAHMKIFMITGDNEITAKAVAKKIGLMNERNEFPEVIQGVALQNMSDEAITACFKNRALIFSRVSPTDKFRIVDLLKKNGEIVAVTGDGVNDTLSLKRADIGVAMGLNGSKVAQEAANIVLLDDNFSTIVVAVKEGRTILRNLEKSIKANLAANVAELTCVLAGFASLFWNISPPIFAVQILLIDMVGELFPLMMLTFDPPEKRVMELPPRDPKAKILTRHALTEILYTGLIIGIVSYCAFFWMYHYEKQSLDHYEKAVTVTFVSIIIGQYANLLSRRTYTFALGRYLFSNMYLLLAFAFSFSLTLLIVYVPTFNKYFHTAPLPLSDWKYPFVAGLVCLAIFEIIKFSKTKPAK